MKNLFKNRFVSLQNHYRLKFANVNVIDHQDNFCQSSHIRDRSFNLKGGGGYGFLCRSEYFFRTTQELEYLFFLWRTARIFFPEFNIRLLDKNSESDHFFFLHQNQNIFFSNIGNQNIFLENKHNKSREESAY